MIDWVYLRALGLTVLVEGPLVAHAAQRDGGDVRAAIPVILGANLLTHGTLWTVFPMVPWPYPLKLVVAETLVILVEGAIYAAFRVFPTARAFDVSARVNLVTTGIGLLMFAWRV